MEVGSPVVLELATGHGESEVGDHTAFAARVMRIRKAACAWAYTTYPRGSPVLLVVSLRAELVAHICKEIQP